MNQRRYPRVVLESVVHIAIMQAGSGEMIWLHEGTILNASATGFLIRVHQREAQPEPVPEEAALTPVEGERVTIHIFEMDMDIEGTIVRIHQTGPAWVDIAVDYTAHAPASWREHLTDLLASLGAMLTGAGSRSSR